MQFISIVNYINNIVNSILIKRVMIIIRLLVFRLSPAVDLNLGLSSVYPVNTSNEGPKLAIVQSLCDWYKPIYWRIFLLF